MSLLKIIEPLLNAKTATANFTVSKTAEGRIVLVVQPVCAVDDKSDAELIALKAALSLPIKIEGDDIPSVEAAMRQRVSGLQSKRDEWADQVAQIEAALEAAKAAKAAKSTTTVKASSTPKTASSSAKSPAKESAPKPAPVVEADEAAVSDDALFDL